MPLLLGAVAILIYVNTLANEFVFDTTAYLLATDRLHDLTDLGAVLRTRRWFADFTLAVNWAIEGPQPRGYHLFNLAVHGLAAVTLYGLVGRVLRRRGASETRAALLAGAAALVWLVHPLNTQAVAYVVQRHESLMGLFYLLTLYLTGRVAAAQEAGDDARPRTALWAAAAIGACLLGMGSKEVMVTAPVVAMLFDRSFYGGTFGAALRRRWWLYLGYATTWLAPVISGLGGVFQQETSAGFGMPLVGPMGYLMTQGGVILHYLRLAVWPHPLVLDYFWPPAPLVLEYAPERLWTTVVLPVAAVALLLGISIYGLVRNTWWGFVGFAFFAVLSVSSSVLPIADMAFEHRMYLPLTCVVTLVIIGGWKGLQRLVTQPRMAAAIGGAVVLVVAVIFSGLTVQRNSEYATKISIWRTVTERAPLNPRGFHNLAAALKEAGDNVAAMEAYEAAVDLSPNYAEAQYGIGQLWNEQGRPDLAVPWFERAITNDPSDAAYHHGLANALSMMGNLNAALAEANQAIELDPMLAKAYNLRGSIRARLGRIEAGLADVRQAVDLDPELTDAWYNLGLTLQRAGRPGEAAAAYAAALETDATHVGTLRQYGRLLATAPDESLRNPTKAIRLMERYSRVLGGADPFLLDTFAAANAHLARFDLAVSQQQQAIDAATRGGLPPEAIDAMRDRLERYRSGRAYVDEALSAEPAALPH